MKRAVALVSLGLVACDANAGLLPPPATLNFPSAMLVTPEVEGRQYLLIANANFDVRYNSGSLLSFDLSAMRAAIASCGDPPCQFPDVRSFVVGEVFVGSHATGLALGTRGDRVYLASRSDGDIGWIDFNPATGGLGCEGTGQPPLCADARRGARVDTSCGRTLNPVGDPIALIVRSATDLDPGAPAATDAIIVAHRNGTASLYVESPDRSLGPVLVDTLTGLPPDLVQATFEPNSRALWTHSAFPAFVHASRANRAIGRVGVRYDGERPSCPSLVDLGPWFLRGVDDGYDTRDSAFSPDGRFAYIVTRRPEALVRLDLEQQALFPADAPIDWAQHVGFGPSRIERLGDTDVLAVSCFDDRRVWFIDGPRGVSLGSVPRFSGAFEMASNAEHDLLWVGDFRDSTFSAIDIRGVATGQSPRLAAVFGTVRPVGVLR